MSIEKTLGEVAEHGVTGNEWWVGERAAYLIASIERDPQDDAFYQNHPSPKYRAELAYKVRFVGNVIPLMHLSNRAPIIVARATKEQP